MFKHKYLLDNSVILLSIFFYRQSECILVYAYDAYNNNLKLKFCFSFATGKIKPGDEAYFMSCVTVCV